MRRVAFCVMFGALLMPLRAAAQETVEYYGTDAIGSVRIVFDANGNVVGRMDYGPFGEQVTVSTVGHKSYAGLFRDGEAGLDYAEARSYQVRTGRFSAPDPVYAGLFQPQAWNRYSYALNNPLTFVDPTGMQADSCTTVDTYTEDGLVTTLKCKNSNTDSGGGGWSLWGDLSWFFGGWMDRFTLATTTGSSVPGEDERVPTSRYQPSQVAKAIDTASVVAAVVFPVAAKAAGAAVVEGAVTKTAAEIAADSVATQGIKVYRVFGGQSRGMGQSFTTVEPWSVPNFRAAAGLPSENSGSFLLEGVLTDPRGVLFRPSLPGAGGLGGLPEVVVPNPSGQVRVLRVWGLNPPW